MPADRRAHREQQRHRGKTVLIVAREVEIAIEQQIGLGMQAAVPQVHQQKSEIVECVGRRQRGVELETVERRRLAADHRDIGEVQVTMAVAHPSARGAPVEAVATGTQHIALVAQQRRHRCRLEQRRKACQRLAIAIDHGGEAVGPLAVDDRLGGGMKKLKSLRQPAEQRRIEPTASRAVVEQRVVGETAHFEQPVDSVAMPVDRQTTIGLARDRMQREIEIGCGAAVEPQFRFERRVAACGRREVEIVEAHRALELPRAIAGEENARGMGIDAPDGRIGAKGPAFEKGDDVLAGVAGGLHCGGFHRASAHGRDGDLARPTGSLGRLGQRDRRHTSHEHILLTTVTLATRRVLAPILGSVPTRGEQETRRVRAFPYRRRTDRLPRSRA
jgi:hypothetical protein